MRPSVRVSMCCVLLACGCAGRALPFDVVGAPPSSDMVAPAADLSSAPDLAPPPHKIVFTTSQSFTGNLGGLAGADAKCQQLAGAAGLTGTFKAWLSDSRESPATRFVRSTVPYQMVTGTVIAEDWSALVRVVTGVSTIHHGIDRDERGGLVPPIYPAPCSWAQWVHPVWTDTDINGEVHALTQTCNDWTAADADGGLWGDTRSEDSWSDTCSGGPCSFSAYLFCFEQ